jgi:hypothetical protein
LNRAEFRWKWLRFLGQTFWLGIGLCLLLLLLGAALVLGWIASKPLATALYVVIAVAGFIGWVAIMIGAAAKALDHSWLAAAVERVDRRLLDRLNTLLFLEQRPQARADSFAARIAKQAHEVMAEKKPPSPFAANRTVRLLVVFLAALTTTLVFYQGYAPWARLPAAQPARGNAPAKAQERPPELALPATNNVEQKQPWGEVRITDPGADLQVTKVDVVPLQIEAAANQPLKRISWLSTVNGAQETPHDLPPPTDARYAVYQPTLYLDELNLSDWDVLTYYAKADAANQDTYASGIYFIEVRPFREELQKLPGGEGGRAYKTLNEMSSLISRQQHVIRQTHQHIQKPPEPDKVAAQDRKKLSEAEADLGKSAGHLYAEMAGQMENTPIGEALDNLAKAQKTLTEASGSLQTNAMTEARNRERQALLELVAARKVFQKSVSDNPGDFQDTHQEEAGPTADASKQLSRMAEFRDEAKAARQFVKKALEQQEEIERQTRASPLHNDYPGLAKRERQLKKSLEDFQQQHPKAFKDANAEFQQAARALDQAAESLQNRHNEAGSAAHQAGQQLQTLSQAMQGGAAQQQLADAYKLKEMLDRQIRTLDQRAKPRSQVSDQQLQDSVSEARQTINQLKKVAEEEPTRQAFDQPLRDALNKENTADIESKLSQLEQPPVLDPDRPDPQQRAAAEARDALGKVSQAFNASEPKGLQTARKNDSLKPNPQDSFSQGIAELDSLIDQLEKNRPISPEDQGKQARQALQGLQQGLPNLQAEDSRTEQLMQKLDQLLKFQTPLDAQSLKKLRDELQRFSVEATSQLAKEEDKPAVSNIDPARLPPAYRGRIQKYFQKLSE